MRAQHAARAQAASRDDEDAAGAAALLGLDEGQEGRVGGLLGHAVQVEAGGDRVLAALQPLARAAVEALAAGGVTGRRLGRRERGCRGGGGDGGGRRLGGGGRRWRCRLGLGRARAERPDVPHRMLPERQILRARRLPPAAHHPAAWSSGGISSTTSTSRRRGPCAPSSIFCAMSPVRDGPVMRLTERGGWPSTSRRRCQLSS